MDKVTQIKMLTQELLQYCHEYYGLDNPSVSDVEYDKKFDALKKMEDEANFWLANSPTRKVQGEVLPYLTKVRHSVPMLSSDKSTEIKDVEKFIGNHPVVVSYKLDGSTVVLKYNNHKLIQALSRGSGYEGEDITHTAKMIKNLPETISYAGYLEIRGEAVISWDDYNEMSKSETLGHPRNVVSGALRQLDANEAARRNIYFYAFTIVNWREIVHPTHPRVKIRTKGDSLGFLATLGFDVVQNIINTNPMFGFADVKGVLKLFNRETYGIPTDGWCFEYNDLEYGESLGSTEHHDRKLYALKPQAEEHQTYFRGIEYNTCRTGIVSMTALFDPVEIGNTMVSRATLHNCNFFDELKLGKGDVITVTKFNEIIPGIMDNKTRSGSYKLIDTCPSCGGKLEIKSTGTANVLYCPNEDCPSRKLAQFTHFVSKKGMDIDGLSEATLSLLISNGYISNFRSIYTLHTPQNELAQLPGMGAKSVEKLLQSIEKSRNVKLENFICAHGIPNIGLTASKTISKYCDGDWEKFYTLIKDTKDFTFLDDFGKVMSDNLNYYLDDNFIDMDFLASEMNFIVSEKRQIVKNQFTGKVLCVTGKLNHFTRDSINEKIISLGAKPTGSVSKKTDYLITNEVSGSSKYKKAMDLGVPVITEKDFLKMIGE